MTEKELRKLNRYQLLELLVMETEQNQKLRAELELAQQQLQQRHLQMAELGSLAEAALQLNGVFEAAQRAADDYLEGARREAEQILRQAHVASQTSNGEEYET